MQLANKQDWARYHSYEVHQMAELVDSHMRPGPWQKVGYFRKVRPPSPPALPAGAGSPAEPALMPGTPQQIPCPFYPDRFTWPVCIMPFLCISGDSWPSMLDSDDMLQALNTIPRERAEWFIWLDMDMVVENVTFDLPLDSYEGRDIIMWGQPEWIAKGHNAKGSQGRPSLSTSNRVRRGCTACEDAQGGARVSTGGLTQSMFGR